jgi:putative transposase
MTRPLRIHYQNACYHVMNRGAGRKNIFRNNLHRTVFLEILAESQRIFNIKLYAYCLMDKSYSQLLCTRKFSLGGNSLIH